MGLSVTIAGTERRKMVKKATLKVTRVLDHEPDTCEFVVDSYGDRTLALSVGQVVEVSNGGTKMFGGRIVRIDSEYRQGDFEGLRVECTDWTHDLNRRLVTETYENMTVDAIVADLLSNWFPAGFTAANVDAPVTVDYISFSYEQLGDCLRQLAEISDMHWYVDPDKDVHMRAATATEAPFELSDTNGKYIYGSLRINRDLSQVRNVVYVRGGEYLGDTLTVAREGDGTHRIFGTEYRLSDIKVTVTGQEYDLGVDPTDPEGPYDALHNMDEKLVKFRADRIPADGAAIRISGRPWLPVLVKRRDRNSIATFSAAEGADSDGEYQAIVVDRGIGSKEGARQRAQAELYAYAATREDAAFDTYTDGLVPGQRIRIQSDLRSINERYVVNRVVARDVKDDAGGTTLAYQVRCIDGREYGFLDFLRSLVTDKRKELDIADDEVLDTVESAVEQLNLEDTWTRATEHNLQSEQLNLEDTWTAQGPDYPVQWVLGPYTPGGIGSGDTKRPFRLGTGRLS